MKTVKDITAQKNVTVDESKARVFGYCNKERRITMTAPIVQEAGELFQLWAKYEVEGTIDTIEERLHAGNNHLLHSYYSSVGFKPEVNDPNRTLYLEFISKIKENESKYFDSYGDYIESDIDKALAAAGVFVEPGKDVIREVNAITVEEYCRRTGAKRKTVLHDLEHDKLDGRMFAGQWFLPETTDGLYIIKSPIPDGYVSLKQYCEDHGCDLRNTRRKVMEGRIPGMKIGKSWFVPKG